jgi:hypothetical protein
VAGTGPQAATAAPPGSCALLYLDHHECSTSNKGLSINAESSSTAACAVLPRMTFSAGAPCDLFIHGLVKSIGVFLLEVLVRSRPRHQR